MVGELRREREEAVVVDGIAPPSAGLFLFGDQTA